MAGSGRTGLHEGPSGHELPIHHQPPHDDGCHAGDCKAVISISAVILCQRAIISTNIMLTIMMAVPTLLRHHLMHTRMTIRSGQEPDCSTDQVLHLDAATHILTQTYHESRGLRIISTYTTQVQATT